MGVHIAIGASPLEREWTLRIHLRKDEEVVNVTRDGIASAADILELRPTADSAYFPLLGAGSSPPIRSGSVIELKVPRCREPHAIQLQLQGGADSTALVV